MVFFGSICSYLQWWWIQQCFPVACVSEDCCAELLQEPQTLVLEHSVQQQHGDSWLPWCVFPLFILIEFLPIVVRSLTSLETKTDISANGANYVVPIGGAYYRVFGTSASSPVVGAIITLLNDARITIGKKPLGFLNPVLVSRNFIFSVSPGIFCCRINEM